MDDSHSPDRPYYTSISAKEDRSDHRWNNYSDSEEDVVPSPVPSPRRKNRQAKTTFPMTSPTPRRAAASNGTAKKSSRRISRISPKKRRRCSPGDPGQEGRGLPEVAHRHASSLLPRRPGMQKRGRVRVPEPDRRRHVRSRVQSEGEKTDEIVALKRLKMERKRKVPDHFAPRSEHAPEGRKPPECRQRPGDRRRLEHGQDLPRHGIRRARHEGPHGDAEEPQEVLPHRPSQDPTPPAPLRMRHMHSEWILHRDLKTSNLLLSHKGILKIGDFGLPGSSGIPQGVHSDRRDALVSSAGASPGTKKYSTAIDMWSVGCIFAEFLKLVPLFPGKSEMDEINKIFTDLGTPSEKIWPGYSELPFVKTCSFTHYPYNQLRKKFGSNVINDTGFQLLNKRSEADSSGDVPDVAGEERTQQDSHADAAEAVEERRWKRPRTEPGGDRDVEAAERRPAEDERRLQFAL
ncbi:hypothetical protein L596_028503 [Steinernema carpocapsae]|uniref:Protein kinase domain-containing protein n=1 Tax=Steinernema carpocapsae TaxID=34508 RepID=A0A4U5LYL8_STECR|nr:hypothetical protein L596_028503 [Steinernema carpocapsae]